MGGVSADVHSWLAQWASGLTNGDGEAIAGLFAEHGLWRDYLAFGPTLQTHEGRMAIAAAVDRVRLGPIGALRAEAPSGASEGFVSFSTALGRCQGYVRLVEGQALTLFTMLHDLAAHPFPVGPRRRSGLEATGEAWSERRAREQRLGDAPTDPAVLIVGAGQAGLALAATLKLLDVPTLIVDRQPRVGDQRRSRYKSLTLHDPVWYDHLPFVPFPDHWPVFTPKDKMGDWLEHYAGIMELDPWTGTELVSARHDADAGRWLVNLSRHGRAVQLRPVHLVMALGNAGFPRVPVFPGQDVFAGRQYHSSAHPGGEGLSGKRVVVIGANNSAHDICADLVAHGAHATMVQRSSTHIVRQSTMTDVLLGSVYSEAAVAAGLTIDKADILAASVPLRLQEQLNQATWAAIREQEAPFYQRLADAGFALDFGEDGTGIASKYLRTASGYYIDVGASAMIADGRIALKSGTEVSHLTKAGVAFADGTHLDADLVIYATGFGAMEEWVARLIGADVAERIGRCWGYGSGTRGDPGPWEGELRNMWKPTAQDGLWFMGGNLAQVRFYSRLLGLQLKARLEGLID